MLALKAQGRVRARITRMDMRVRAYGTMTITGMAGMAAAGHARLRAPPWAGPAWALGPVVALEVVPVVAQAGIWAGQVVETGLVIRTAVVRATLVVPAGVVSALAVVAHMVVAHQVAGHLVVDNMVAPATVPAVAAPKALPHGAERPLPIEVAVLLVKDSAIVRGLFCIWGMQQHSGLATHLRQAYSPFVGP